MKSTFCFLVLGLALASTAGDNPAPDNGLVIAAAVDARNAIPLRRGIFSIAADTTLGGYGTGNPAAVKIMQAVRPPYLRVPGGDSMNLWDWNSGTPRSEEQLQAFGESTENPKVATALKNRQGYFKLMGGPMTADRWAGLASEGGAEPIWGLNVTTTSPSDTRTFMLRLQSERLPAFRFELGNELYLSKVWKRQVPDAETYVRKAKAHAQEVKDVFPGAKIAVCVNAPLAPMALGPGDPPTDHSWDAPIAKESFYDAVVLHDYAMSGELGDLRDISADEYSRWALVRSSEVFLGRVYGWLGRVFPGREIWVTEWNLNQNIYKRNHPEEGSLFMPARTILSGLFVANFLLNSAAYPSDVALANYWQICGEPEFGLISGEPPREQPAFHVFRMLSSAIHACDRIAPVSMPQAPCLRGPGKFAALEAPAIEGFALFEGDNLRYLAFVNFTDRSAVVRMNSKQACEIETLTGPELLPGWNCPTNGPLNAWAPSYELRKSKAGLEAVELAPRSFSVVAVGMNR